MQTDLKKKDVWSKEGDYLTAVRSWNEINNVYEDGRPNVRRAGMIYVTRLVIIFAPSVINDPH